MRAATNWLWGGLFAAGALYGLAILQRAEDPGFLFHGLLFLTFCIAAVLLTVRAAAPVLTSAARR